jgi:hypothetical protein
MLALAIVWLWTSAAADTVRPSAEEADLLESCFPSSDEIKQWVRSDSIRIFEGRELYLLIDGGADIYLEYGFVRAGTERFANAAGNQISLEMYEMKGPESAYGIFSFLAAGTGRPASFGQAGTSGEDFVIFWKGRFVVSVTALDEGGRAGLSEVARAVDLKMKSGGSRPALTEVLLQPAFANSEVVYLRGALGFDRQAGPGHGSRFRFREGVSGMFGKCQTFVLRYETSAERDSARWRVLDILVREAGYTEERAGDGARILKSRRGGYLYVLDSGRHLLLVSGVVKQEVLETGARLKTAAAGLER